MRATPHLAPLLALAALAACKRDTGGPQPAPSASQVASAAPSQAPPAAPPEPRTRVGASIALTAPGDALVVADEDRRVLVRFAMGEGGPSAPRDVPMPGAPAQIVALADRVLVTIRDPGLLLELDPATLAERRRAALPPDAWGLSVDRDAKTAVVTAPWPARVAVVDLAAMTARDVAVPREPRGVVVHDDARVAYVSHLTQGAITRVSLEAVTATQVALPPSPLRAPMGKVLSASLGYALALSADGRRLFAARHAIGARGHESWAGASTVDVLLTSNDTPLSPGYFAGAPKLKSDLAGTLVSGSDVELPGNPLTVVTQPRAMLLRRKSSSLLVVSEGNDELVELDALAVDPTMAVEATYPLGSKADPALGVSSSCAAPSGVALSTDEATAYVHCRASFEVAVVKLREPDGAEQPAAPAVLRFAEDPLPQEARAGRRLFYSARDRLMSGGLGCAGCHPEGRDDGQVWHEVAFTTADGENTNFVGIAENVPAETKKKGVPRRTPLLVGRVDASGPYGWRAESRDLASRIKASFGLHRWGGLPRHEPSNLDARALYLVPFLRTALVPPPTPRRPLTEQEQRGQELFARKDVGCASCHDPAGGFTTRVPYPLPERPAPPGFDREPAAMYKTPGLVHLAGRAPYLHDGSAPSLDELISANKDRMGKTSHLSDADRQALVAYLKTL